MNNLFANFGKYVKTSYIAWAIIGLVAIDLVVAATFKYWPIDHFNSPNRSWVWYAVKDFHKSKSPDIVLLGSSLMMAVVHGGDATHYNEPQNAAFHHRSNYLEELLKQKSGVDARTFAFVIGGQMVSDAYVLATRTLSGDNRPKMIIYGIAPRDFMDNTLASPAATETYRYVSRIANLSDLDWESRNSPWEKVEYLAGKLSSIYNKRLDFVYLHGLFTKSLLANIFGMSDMETVRAPFALRGMAMLQLPEDTGPGEVCVNPYSAKEAKYSDNIAQYTYRYLPFKPKAYNKQMSYLEKLLAWGKEEGIEIVLVNMPITDDNIKLLGTDFYNKTFMPSIAGLAEKNGAQFIDMNDAREFPKTCFEDSVHLNGLGAVRFLNILTDKLATSQQVALSKAGLVR